jgi:hypothetical protein
LASVRAEGLEPSAADLTLFVEVAAGQLTTDELRDRIVSRYQKGSLFCLPQHLESYGADIFGRLAAADLLRDFRVSSSSADSLSSWPTSTPCTRSGRATAGPSVRSSPSSRMTPGIGLSRAASDVPDPSAAANASPGTAVTCAACSRSSGHPTGASARQPSTRRPRPPAAFADAVLTVRSWLQPEEHG